MEPNPFADYLRKTCGKRTQFECVQPNDEITDTLIEAGFSNYSPYNCIIDGLKDFFHDCLLLSAHVSNSSAGKGGQK